MLTKEEFLREIPKTDLHVHLDGSLRLSTLIDLAKEKNVTLPSYTEEGMRELVFKDKVSSPLPCKDKYKPSVAFEIIVLFPPSE